MTMANTTAVITTPQVSCRLKTVSLKVTELPIPVRHAVEGQNQNDSYDRSQQRQQQCLDHE